LSRASVQCGEPQKVELKPAISIKKSVTPEFIICLEDGKKFKSLKRHLRSQYDMSPEEYREKWGLPHDYPMVAPAYAAARSDLAKNMGLGRRGTAVAGTQPEVAAKAEPEKPGKAQRKQPRKAGSRK
jgi:predicted transcriptional regulator